VGYQASLHEQFEFIMKNWGNPQVFPPLHPDVHANFFDELAGEDPIIGANEDDPTADRVVVYPTKVTPASGGDVNVQVQQVQLARFVRMMGGGYFFCPGIKSLAQLAGESVS
jgi:hypothetical protein